MTDALVPRAAPVGWVAVVRPDRTVLHDGPLEQLDGMLREALEMLGQPELPRAPAAEHAGAPMAA
jgi:3-(3-hydroxy-phenyl)propionate hydroxylase